MSRRGGPCPKESDDIITLRRLQIKRTEIAVRLRRRRDAALVHAPERFDCILIVATGALIARLTTASATLVAPRPEPAAAAIPAAARTRPRRVGRRPVPYFGFNGSPPLTCSYHLRRNRSPFDQGLVPCRRDRHCPAGIAPGYYRSIVHRVVARVFSSISTTCPFNALHANRCPSAV